MSGQLIAIKKSIQKSVGSPVILICRSRRRERKSRGLLEGAYGSLFTVKTVVDGSEVRQSYTYSDILTHAVTIRPVGADDRKCP